MVQPQAGYAGRMPSLAHGPGPDTAQAWRTGTARPAPPPMPAPTNRPQQTERADPLNGAGGPPQVPGTSRTISEAPEIDPGKALGASSRGNGTPKGEDRHPVEDRNSAPDASPLPSGAEPGEEEDLDKEQNDEDTIGGHIGGSGAMASKFSNPSSAGAYGSFAANMSGQPPAARIFSGRPAGTSSANTTARKAPKRDEGQDDEV